MSNTFSIECSSCLRPLVKIQKKEDDASLNWKAKANCPYCGDSSFLFDFNGKFEYSGIEDDGIPKTMIVDIDTDEEKIIFKVVKV